MYSAYILNTEENRQELVALGYTLHLRDIDTSEYLSIHIYVKNVMSAYNFTGTTRDRIIAIDTLKTILLINDVKTSLIYLVSIGMLTKEEVEMIALKKHNPYRE